MQAPNAIDSTDTGVAESSLDTTSATSTGEERGL